MLNDGKREHNVKVSLPDVRKLVSAMSSFTICLLSPILYNKAGEPYNWHFTYISICRSVYQSVRFCRSICLCVFRVCPVSALPVYPIICFMVLRKRTIIISYFLSDSRSMILYSFFNLKIRQILSVQRLLLLN